MPIPLVTQHYPDDFKILSYNPQANPVAGTNAILLYADRTMVIDSITVTVQVIAAAAATASFEVNSNPVNTSGTVIAVANLAETAGDTIFLDGVNNSSGNVRKISATGTAGSSSGSTQLKFLSPTNTSIDNVVPAGSFLVIDYTGTPTAFRGLIQIRYRSRLA